MLKQLTLSIVLIASIALIGCDPESPEAPEPEEIVTNGGCGECTIRETRTYTLTDDGQEDLEDWLDLRGLDISDVNEISSFTASWDVVDTDNDSPSCGQTYARYFNNQGGTLTSLTEEVTIGGLTYDDNGTDQDIFMSFEANEVITVQPSNCVSRVIDEVRD